jgi:hypothetical protein
LRYPNIRYGNPTELNFYATGIPLAVLARRLRRDERTVRDWMDAKTRVPWWVPEVLRLQQMEARDIMRQHTQHIAGKKLLGRPLAVVTPAGELEARRQDVKKPQPMTALRLDEFGTGPESQLEAHTG